MTRLGWQVNPAPQSPSTWQGSCQVKAHCLTVVVVHTSVETGMPASQAVLSGHAGPTDPPEHA
jgi:hypothetical protein